MRQIYIIYLLLPLFFSCGRPITSAVYHDERYVDSAITYRVVDSHTQTDPYLDSLILTYKVSMEESMNKVIGYTHRPLTKAQPESTMGYLAADALYAYATGQDSTVAGAVVNYGGIRINYLSSGPITIGHIFEIMPFDNKVVILHVPGSIIRQWCDHMAERGGWPIYGIKYEIKDKTAQHILIGNKPINDHIIYKVATTDYIANGGDNCEFLKGLKRDRYNKFHRDTMIDYLNRLTSNNDTLNYQLENRISHNE